jgi:hypothetical protein
LAANGINIIKKEKTQLVLAKMLTNAQGVFGAYAVVERTFSWEELK